MKNGRRAERQHAATGAMTGQRMGKESSQGVCQRFHAGPILLEGVRRGVQYRVEEPNEGAAILVPGGEAVLFTPP